MDNIQKIALITHTLIALGIIALVLLQRGKGAEIGAVFGSGASSTVFGSRGAGNFLTKLTTISAVIFMLTSLSLSYLWTTSASDRLFDEPVAAEETPAPAEEPLFEEVETLPAQPESSSAFPALPEPAAEAESE